MNQSDPHLQIQDILKLPDLDKLSEKELRELIEPLIPYARKPNITYAADAASEMIAKLEKLMKNL
jgi:alkylhydroperoxidase/carboxymuconolactone decarboxylase family protein YurZ